MLEVDERFSRLILPFIKPDYLVVTNLFRDSIKRNAHPEYIFSILDTYVPETTKLILNADCLQSSQLLKNNNRVYFGVEKLDTDVTECVNLINDFSICPNCDEKLKYNYLRYHHIGNAYCPKCGFKSYEANYRLTNIDYEKQSITVDHSGVETVYPMVNRALYNIYNELAAITLMSEFGVDLQKVKDYMKKISITQTRYKENKAGKTEIVRTMAKGQNSVSCSRTLDFVGHEDGDRTVFIMIDDLFERRDSSEFIGWIYDADFEFLNTDGIKQIVLAGPRCFDYKLRLLIAGVPEERILCEEDEFKAVDIMDKDIDKLYLLHDTSTYDLACKVESKIISVFTEAYNSKGGEQ